MTHVRDREASVLVTKSDEGAALSTIVRRVTGSAWTAAKNLVTTGRVAVDDRAVTDPGTRVRAGQQICIRPAAPKVNGPAALARNAIVHVDAHLCVVDKPSGISTVPYEPGERGTLVDRVRVVLHRHWGAPANAPLYVVHRLDKETSGVMVFARSWLGKRHLAALFRDHTIERVYLALITGSLPRERVTFETHLVENRGDGLRGSAKQRGLGIRAVTHVHQIARLSPTVSLVRCRLETGRTHQIRIHLAEASHPLMGERVYSRHWSGPPLNAPRTMLHAAVLGFAHPDDPARRMHFVSKLPEDFAAFALANGASSATLERAYADLG